MMPIKREKLLHILILLFVQVSLYLPFSTSTLISDDWALLNRNVFHGLNWFSIDQNRPFFGAYHKLIFSIFGMNTEAEALVHILMHILVVFSLYLLLCYLSKMPFFAFSIALIYSIYPADYSRMWLTMADTMPIWLMIFVYTGTLFAFSKNGKPAFLAFALLFFTIPLFLYESQLGLTCAICVVFSVVTPGISIKRRIGLLSPLFIAFMFAIWRIVIMPTLAINDFYFSTYVLNPFVLIRRVLRGWGVLFWGWSRLFAVAVGSDNKLVALWIFPVLFAFGSIGLWLARRKKDENLNSIKDQTHRLKKYGFYIGISAFLICAGFLPFSVIMSPNTDTFGSRTNMYAIPGGAILIISLFNLLGSYLLSSEKQVHRFVICAMIPLVLIGLATGWENQRQARIAWHKQIIIWNRLFDIAPDFEDDTAVYLVMPEYHQPKFLRRVPLLDGWETESAIQVLYNNQTLKGGIIFLKDQREPQIGRTILKQEGIGLSNQKQFIPYSKAVFVSFDSKSQRFAFISNLEQKIGLNFSPSDYHPELRVRFAPRPKSKDFRYLLGAPAIDDTNPLPYFR